MNRRGVPKGYKHLNPIRSRPANCADCGKQFFKRSTGKYCIECKAARIK